MLPAAGVSVLQFEYRMRGWRGLTQARHDLAAALEFLARRQVLVAEHSRNAFPSRFETSHQCHQCLPPVGTL